MERGHDRLAGEHAWESAPAHHTPARSLNAVPSAVQSAVRSRYDDSWIEVSSRPSSSSLSSAADDATDALRTRHDSIVGRRRRPLSNVRGGIQMPRRSHSAGASSQEEYDESESESDRVMTSSNEALGPSPLRRGAGLSQLSSASSDNLGDAEEDGDDGDDENATAINAARGQPPVFQPQPNAFNRPLPPRVDGPAMSRQGTATSPYGGTTRPALRTGSQRHSYPTQPTQHSPLNVVSSSYQADQDAALRASLSTLLSCAAAARSLPKPSMASAGAPARSSRVEPSALRIVPESVVLGGPSAATHPSARGAGDAATSASQPSPRSRSADKSKRSSAEANRDRRATKKRRASSGFACGPGAGAPSDGLAAQSGYGLGSYSVDDISPTLLTWVVSAGVVVLVGALSFSAGYSMGREAGSAEAMGGVSCGRQAAMATRGSGGGGTLRRLRWSDGLTV